MSFILTGVYAQQYEFGVSGVTTGYMGDINSTNPFYFKNLGGGLFAKYNFDPTWGVKIGFNHLYISGSDTDFKETRGLFFNNQVSELALTGEFNFFKYIPGRQLNRYTPYVIGGIAVIKHDPYITLRGIKTPLEPLKLEEDENKNPVSYSKFTVAIPVGVGFKYNIKGPWSIGAEIVYRTVLSDNIDNVSQYYPTPKLEKVNHDDWEYLADPSNKLTLNSGKARGDGKKLDGYMTAGITLTYTIISKKCYWWQ